MGAVLVVNSGDDVHSHRKAWGLLDHPGNGGAGTSELHIKLKAILPLMPQAPGMCPCMYRLQQAVMVVTDLYYSDIQRLQTGWGLPCARCCTNTYEDTALVPKSLQPKKESDIWKVRGRSCNQLYTIFIYTLMPFPSISINRSSECQQSPSAPQDWVTDRFLQAFHSVAPR